jgi:hypothetical protein
MRKTLLLAAILGIGMMFMGCQTQPRIPCVEMEIFGGGIDMCEFINEEGAGPECNMAKRIATELECQIAVGQWEDMPDWIREIILEVVCSNIAEADVGVCSELGLPGQVCAEGPDCESDICTDGKCE